jgi:hypothetical protein
VTSEVGQKIASSVKFSGKPQDYGIKVEVLEPAVLFLPPGLVQHSLNCKIHTVALPATELSLAGF